VLEIVYKIIQDHSLFRNNSTVTLLHTFTPNQLFTQIMEPDEILTFHRMMAVSDHFIALVTENQLTTVSSDNTHRLPSYHVAVAKLWKKHQFLLK
jgi:hypothetical protein